MLEDCVREIIREEVVTIVRGQISEMFGSIKTMMMEFFDDHYTAIVEMVAVATSRTVAATCARSGRAFQY